MKVEIHPEIYALLQEKGEEQDIEHFINSILFLYAKDGFIRRSEVAGMVVVNRVFKKKSAEAIEVFDQVTKDFKGVVVVGKHDSESIWVPSIRLHDLLEKNQVVLVMKTPRSKGISVEEVEETYLKVREEDYS